MIHVKTKRFFLGRSLSCQALKDPERKPAEGDVFYQMAGDSGAGFKHSYHFEGGRWVLNWTFTL